MKKIRKYLIIILIILIVIFLLTKVFSFAKYVSNHTFNHYLESKGFYLSSDKLDIEPVQNIDKAYDGEPIKIVLKNSLNKEAITTYDIKYKAECSVSDEYKDKVGCRFTDNNESTFEGVLSNKEVCVNNTNDGKDVSDYSKSECEMNGYTYTTKVNTKDLYVDIYSLNDEEYNDVTVNVKVESTSPYKKTMSGDFILHKKRTDSKEVVLKYKETDTFSNLIITNKSTTDKCLTLKWDSKVFHLDNSNINIISSSKDEDNYLNEIKFKVNANSNINYRFYKVNFNETYDETAFSIEENSC